jgi:hypothetical protein
MHHTAGSCASPGHAHCACPACGRAKVTPLRPSCWWCRMRATCIQARGGQRLCAAGTLARPHHAASCCWARCTACRAGLALPVARPSRPRWAACRSTPGALATLQGLPQVTGQRPAACGSEHALEVQLPFLQAVLGSGWKLVPLAVGDATPGRWTGARTLWGGDETLLVVSSDLSHYLPYEQAQERDWHTVQRILSCVDDLHGDEACGAAPLNGALRAARRHAAGAAPAGPAQLGRHRRGAAARVVGYAALAFEAVPAFKAPRAGPGPRGAQHGAQRDRAGAGRGRTHTGAAPAAARPWACFVTLHDARGQLRGCVGQLEATQALGEDVRRQCAGAAFGDSRASSR